MVDDGWFGPGDFHAKRPSGIKWTKKILEAEANEIMGSERAQRSFISRWIQAWQDRVLLERLVSFFAQRDVPILRLFNTAI